MFNYILLGVVLVCYNHQYCRNIMQYRKKNPIYNINEKLMNLLDTPGVYPQIIVVPREMEPFELDHMVFLLNII